MTIQSPAKYEICYLVWKRKTPVEVYNETRIAYGNKHMNRTSVFKCCGEFKTVVRLCSMTRVAEDLQL